MAEIIMNIVFIVLALGFAKIGYDWVVAKIKGFFFPAKTISGVPYVIDGDGLAFDGDIRIRLFGLDAPEMDHPEGAISKDHLRRLIGGRAVKVVVKDQDKYGRLVGQVFDADGRDLNAAMVADGYARAYGSFSKAYVGLERQAKRNGAGLWGQGGLQLHPELWRKAQR